MSARWASVLLAVVTATTVGCTKLVSGRCDVDGDCPSHSCSTMTKTCNPVDGGATGGSGGHGGGGGAAGSQGTGGMAFTCLSCTDKRKPICDLDASTCLPCNDSTVCQALNAGTNACVSAQDAGGSKGMCVDCVSNSDCPLKTKPICVSNSCAPCTADSDCAGVGPSVCMVGDGHCATDAETVYVANTKNVCVEPTSASPADAGGGPGTSMHPLCSLESLRLFVSAARDLVVVQGLVSGADWDYQNDAQAPIFIVGQQSAQIAARGVVPAIFSMSSGVLTFRQVLFTQSTTIGIEATGGSLTLEHVMVSKNTGGGILIDGAAFDIENTVVTANGAATDGQTSWSGILIKSTPLDAGVSQLKLDTIYNNMDHGLVCPGSINATGVLVYGNTASQQTINCGTSFMSCGTDAASSMCGAQP